MNQFEEDTGAANKLFVEAVKLVKTADEARLPQHRRTRIADALEEAVAKLNEIIDDYPSSELAVKLISGQDTGSISLEDLHERALGARAKAEHEAAEKGDADAQSNLARMYLLGKGFPKNNVEAVKWYRKAAEQGHEEAKRRLEILEAE